MPYFTWVWQIFNLSLNFELYITPIGFGAWAIAAVRLRSLGRCNILLSRVLLSADAALNKLKELSVQPNSA
jgi:hypothetical protein